MIVDNMFDAYGTLGELELFTETTERFGCWNYGSLLEWWQYYWNGGYTIEKWLTIGMVAILLKWWLYY